MTVKRLLTLWLLLMGLAILACSSSGGNDDDDDDTTPIDDDDDVVVPESCGNSVQEAGEFCDLGPANGTGYGPRTCNATCSGPNAFCSDGEVTHDETCDDGNLTSGDGCTEFCVRETCGDGIVNNNGTEECDEGPNNGQPDGCSSDCQLVGCGNGEVEGAEVCDLGEELNGTGYGPETCNATCSGTNGFCGDGTLQGEFEECDSGEANSDTEPDVCRTDCSLPTCGDGVIDSGEECDGGPVCTDTCTLPPACFEEGDEDGDAVCDPDDNCVSVYNPGQENSDGDSLGDECDNCPDALNDDQVDGDGDGLGDACDICPSDTDNDIDDDTYCGPVDNCPQTSNADQLDSDGDGLGDVCDECPNDAANDSDGDGICGDVDVCPDVADPDQTDWDEAGAGDACDPNGIYVDPAAGSDTTGDGSPNNPFQTLTHAMGQLTAGKRTVYLFPGTYSEAGGETLPIELVPDLNIVGFGHQQTIFDGATRDKIFVTDDRTEYSPDGVIIAQLALTRATTAIDVQPFWDFDVNLGILGVRFEDNTANLFVLAVRQSEIELLLQSAWFVDAETQGAFINIDGDSSLGLTVEDCLFSGNSANGLLVDLGDEAGFGNPAMSAVMRHNVFEFNGGHGLRLEQNNGVVIALTKLELTNNIAWENEGAGLSIVGEDLDANIQNNTLAFNIDSGLNIELGSHQVDHNILWSNGDDLKAISISNYGVNLIEDGDFGSLTSDPLFVDPINGDFHLQEGSPAIDAGLTSPVYNDADGTRADLGAYGGPFSVWP